MGLAAPWIALVGVAASCLLASLYLALTTASRAPVEDLAGRSGRESRRRRITRILDDSPAHARAVGLLKIACDLAVVIATMDWLRQIRGADAPGWPDAALGLTICVLVLWTFTVALPMSIAAHAAPRLINARALLIRVIERALSPLHTAASFIDEVVRRLAGVERRDAEQQIEQEILHVIEEGEASGAIDGQEREMIEAVVGFRDRTVAQIMTPRTQVEAIELTNDLGAVTKLIKTIGHSRIPVYDGTLDHVVGIFYVKDLMHWLAGDGVRGVGRSFDLRAILRPPLFVPETKTVNDLMKDLIQKKVHIAVVLDEYGGTAGLVTIEDIVEEVFGDIQDEYEAPTAETPDVVLKMEDQSADLDAAARIIDVNGLIEPLGVQIPPSDDYDTVGGFVTTTLGKIPSAGEQFSHEQMTFTILEAKPNKVVKVQMKVTPAASGPSDEAEQGGDGEGDEIKSASSAK